MTPSLKDVNEIILGDLARCDVEQCAAFRQCKVEPHYAPIRRGSMDSVVVVARRESQVIYWEDVEEGFNVSPLTNTARF